MAGIEKTFGHYRILDRIAAGGMGVVYCAEDLTLDRLVALKFLSPDTSADEEYRARFLREARVAAGLNHKNTCTVYEVGEVGASTESIEDPGLHRLARHPLHRDGVHRGGNARDVAVERVGRLGVSEALDVASQVCEGLAEAHARRIVHRDLKPQNVMVTRGGLVKIVDFGLAKPLRAARGAGALVSTSDMISAELDDGTVIGTCAYMSPEQAARQAVDPKSDVFSFGIMLYEMLTGRLPFRGDTTTVLLAKILEAEPDPLPSGAGKVPAQLAQTLRRCLQKRPEDRYPDARDLLAELKSVRQRLPETTATSSALETRWLRATEVGSLLGLGRGWLAIAVIPLLIVAGLTYAGFRHTFDARPQTAATPLDSSSVRSDPPAAPAPQDVFTRANQPGSVAVNSLSSRPQIVSRPDPAAKRGPTSPQVPGIDRPPVMVPVTAPTITPPEPPPQTPGMGTLVLDSSPQSSITVDGKLIGITPLAIEMDPGAHDLVMASPDGGRWRGRVEVAGGERRVIRRDLHAVGRLIITSDVWVEVSIDGNPLEQTPVDFPRVLVGLHGLRASRDGYVTQTQEILIEEGRTSYVRLSLEKQP